MAWQRFRTFNVFDEGVREALVIEVDTSLPAERVIRVLEQLRDSRGLPRQIRVDYGPEFISAKLVAWCEEHEVKLHHSQPGKPTQNAYIERFNRSFCHEVLQAHLFGSLDDVREHAWEWPVRYNEERKDLTRPCATCLRAASDNNKPTPKTLQSKVSLTGKLTVWRLPINRGTRKQV